VTPFALRPGAVGGAGGEERIDPRRRPHQRVDVLVVARHGVGARIAQRRCPVRAELAREGPHRMPALEEDLDDPAEAARRARHEDQLAVHGWQYTP